MPKRYLPNDKWARKAKDEGFRARSVYKLQELDEKFHLLKPGMIVLDLGAAPGSWLQYVSSKIGLKGLAIGMDLQNIKHIAPNVQSVMQDILNIEEVIEQTSKLANQQTIDLLLSDAAPSTSGIHDVDQWRSIELNQSALAVGKRVLKPVGRCVLKVFQGADFDGFIKDVKREWKDVRIIKAKTSRDRSTEVYVICTK
ncbi:MAG: RlmE family RNA methyltransferase [Patescibacteria group bacterium]